MVLNLLLSYLTHASMVLSVAWLDGPRSIKMAHSTGAGISVCHRGYRVAQGGFWIDEICFQDTTAKP